MRDDGLRWDDRYRTTTRVEPRRPEALEQWPELEAKLPTAGRMLDVASGPGSVALWAADRGLDVVALDASAVAMALLEQAASDFGHHIDARVVDLDDGLPSDIGELALVVCQRFRDPRLTTTIVDRLDLGGYAVVTVLSAVDVDQPGEFHAPASALLNEFGPDERCEIVGHHEGGGIAHIVVRRR